MEVVKLLDDLRQIIRLGRYAHGRSRGERNHCDDCESGDLFPPVPLRPLSQN